MIYHQDRARRILRDLAGVDSARAAALLQASGGSVRQALLMAATGCGAPAAVAQLQGCDGSLRQALAQAGAQLAAPQ